MKVMATMSLKPEERNDFSAILKNEYVNVFEEEGIGFVQ